RKRKQTEQVQTSQSKAYVLSYMKCRPYLWNLRFAVLNFHKTHGVTCGVFEQRENRDSLNLEAWSVDRAASFFDLLDLFRDIGHTDINALIGRVFPECRGEWRR